MPAPQQNGVWTDDAIDAIIGTLKRPDKALIRQLPTVSGHYAAGVLRGVPFTVVKRLRAARLIDEQWTWASGATPDVGLTPLGHSVQNRLRGDLR